MKTEIQVECLDYMSLLNQSLIIDYTAGVTIRDTGYAVDYGGIVKALYVDANYIYAGGATTNTIQKYNRFDMTLAAESVSYGGSIQCLTGNATHIFAAGVTTQRIRRYLKTTMAYVDQSPDYGGTILAIAVNATHVYIGGTGGVNRLKRYKLSDLSYVDMAGVYGPIWAIALSTSGTGDILVGGETNTVVRYEPIALALKATSVICSSTVQQILDDAAQIYGSCDDGAVFKLWQLPLWTIATTTSDTSAWAMAQDDNYLYVGGGADKLVHRLKKSDLSLNDVSTVFANVIWSIAVDGEDMFVATGDHLVSKYSIYDTIDEVIDELLSFYITVPAITKGTIDATYVNLVRQVVIDGKTILQSLLDLRDTIGGFIEVDNNRELNWTSTLGEDKGQQIRYRKNLLGIEREIDYSKLYNRIYTYGRKADGNRVLLSEIQAEDYVDDPVSQGVWGGIYEASFVNYSIHDAETLLEWANQLLLQYTNPVTSYKINAVDLSIHTGFDFDTLQLGSTVTIIDEDLGIDVEVQVVRIEYPDLLNPQDMEIELSTSVLNVTDTITKLDIKQKSAELII